jgi:hypothetical protein
MPSDSQHSRPGLTRLFPFALTAVAIAAILLITAVAQTPNSTPNDPRGVIRLRVRVKTGETTKGLSRKRFFLIPGTLEQNKALIQTIEQAPIVTRDCYYRSIGGSEALIKWLQEGDCESVYCREIETTDVEGNNAVPEFQRALVAGEKELPNRDLARKWLTVNLPENVREGVYKTRQRELQRLIKQAEDSTGSKVLSVMTDTKGTAYFTELPVGTYVISNLLPIENHNTGILWNCEIAVKPGDLAHEKPFLISNVGDRTVKCVGKEKPLPVCEPTKNSGR